MVVGCACMMVSQVRRADLCMQTSACRPGPQPLAPNRWLYSHPAGPKEMVQPLSHPALPQRWPPAWSVGLSQSLFYELCADESFPGAPRPYPTLPYPTLLSSPLSVLTPPGAAAAASALAVLFVMVLISNVVQIVYLSVPVSCGPNPPPSSPRLLTRCHHPLSRCLRRGWLTRPAAVQRERARLGERGAGSLHPAVPPADRLRQAQADAAHHPAPVGRKGRHGPAELPAGWRRGRRPVGALHVAKARRDKRHGDQAVPGSVSGLPRYSHGGRAAGKKVIQEVLPSNATFVFAMAREGCPRAVSVRHCCTHCPQGKVSTVREELGGIKPATKQSLDTNDAGGG